MPSRSPAAAISAGGSTKDAIRDAALELFSAKGFEQTSLREVADVVGITKASLYYHYASKQDLLGAIIDPIIEHMRSMGAKVDGIAWSGANVRTVLRDYLRGIVQHRHAGALLLRDTVAIINALHDRYPDWIDSSERIRLWLAGPAPTDESTLRAAAALEVITVALVSAEYVPGAPEELVERLLLDCAVTVLGGIADR
ncbi:TetR/AcrR family transcriptional regulator [Nocardia asteroides]|uniref:TetR/AcrR family transcriptional regulator n=1 Tax=Nocardia asteroides TaxID=1824 RepID=UPI001E31B9B4|nr:TetR/AcrR family transcriptional regulator [Nocardia asteroides]UGT59457.1 TetR/AcrR family transcriptional regulator [Nocardia asteroides]